MCFSSIQYHLHHTTNTNSYDLIKGNNLILNSQTIRFLLDVPRKSLDEKKKKIRKPTMEYEKIYTESTLGKFNKNVQRSFLHLNNKNTTNNNEPSNDNHRLY